MSMLMARCMAAPIEIREGTPQCGPRYGVDRGHHPIMETLIGSSAFAGTVVRQQMICREFETNFCAALRFA
jgi:hypothetical protein